jgi:hypothetical protein
MAGDWIQMRHDLPEDPAVISIAAEIGIEEDHVVGKLHGIWSWADRQTIDGNAPSVTPAFLDRYVSVTGFAQAMSNAGWLIINTNGIIFPKFDEYISETAKQRALTARRARKHRAKSNAGSVTVSVTKRAPREEKRREEKREEKKPPRSPRGDSLVPIPGPLNVPAFVRAWTDWQQHRREIKKPLKPTSAKKQLTQFLDWGIQRSIAAIDHTIAKGWQGIREPDGQALAGDPPPNLGYTIKDDERERPNTSTT